MPCSFCQPVDPFGLDDSQHFECISDTYPEFPKLRSSARNGCSLCALLRLALQDKYSAEAIATEESQYDESIRDTWPTNGWDHRVTICRLERRYEKDWVYGNGSGDELYLLHLSFWPYPPRRPVAEKHLNRGALWFSVYADAGMLPLY